MTLVREHGEEQLLPSPKNIYSCLHQTSGKTSSCFSISNLPFTLHRFHLLQRQARAEKSQPESHRIAFGWGGGQQENGDAVKSVHPPQERKASTDRRKITIKYLETTTSIWRVEFKGLVEKGGKNRNCPIPGLFISSIRISFLPLSLSLFLLCPSREKIYCRREDLLKTVSIFKSACFVLF